MLDNEEIFDITIIGGGPTGLFTAFYGGMRQAKVKIMDSLPHLGGQLTALYPEKYIYDVAGFPNIRAQGLVDNLTEQMEMFDTSVVLDQSVQNLDKHDDGIFRIVTDKETHYSKTIIITAGNGAFQPRRLKLENAEKYENNNLHYFIDDLNDLEGRKVVLFGGGDSAVDWALTLEPIAESVTIVHRRDKFRAHEHSVEKLKTSSVNIRTSYEPVSLIGDEEAVQQVLIEERNTSEQQLLDTDAVICNYGFVSTLGPIKDWGLEIDRNSIVVNSKQETVIPGVYAAGDVCTYEGKINLIATGFGEGPTAVNNAKVYMNPEAKVQPKHSTAMFSQNEQV
ncbi:NAD(P)/FAD-dependent oxidoreductase [Salinicoccus albus]|uniref:NAD(P)/FAD-dependent oxidoreductase n=1 Tax=Salinicoccus albus TaxID=418756 RepID=UPI0003688A87|nr:NAD(P)/FAD-dependent oxidoreductase [Salinicoccus albus]